MQSEASAGKDLITPYEMKKISCIVLALLLVVLCAGCSLPERLAEIDKEAVKDVIYAVKNPIDVDAVVDADYEDASFDVSVANRGGGETTYSFDADLRPVKEAIEQIPTEGKYDIRVQLGKFLDQTYEVDFANRTFVRIK